MDLADALADIRRSSNSSCTVPHQNGGVGGSIGGSTGTSSTSGGSYGSEHSLLSSANAGAINKKGAVGLRMSDVSQ